MGEVPGLNPDANTDIASEWECFFLEMMADWLGERFGNVGILEVGSDEVSGFKNVGEPFRFKESVRGDFENIGDGMRDALWASNVSL